MSRLGYTVEKTAADSQARAGRFRTLHNEVLTPLFMPVGTLATVKAQRNETLADSGSQVLLANTYHLLQSPGLDVFRKFGDIHRFMKWDRSVLTDSGGYQIYSLSKHRQMKEEGAWFRTFEGRKVFLSPETSIETQRVIGSDIMMVLDECIDGNASHDEAVRAMQLTHRWAARSLEARGDSPQALFGIVQGACHDDLRVESAQTLREMPFDGIAVGGLAVGEPRAERERVVGLTTPHLPTHLPRYLMGVGTPIDLLEAVHRGIDMFDCILPTAFAAHGLAFTSRGKLRLRRGCYRFETGPLDPACGCPTCRTYDRAYVSHLIKTKESMGWSLVGQHNLYFFHELMRRMRDAILEGRFSEMYREYRTFLDADDLDNPVTRPVARTEALAPVSKSEGDYRLVRSGLQGASIERVSSGETVHRADESPALVAELLDLRKRLIVDSTEPADELVVWDIGSSVATTAMALVQAHAALVAEMAASDIARARGLSLKPLRLVTFGDDVDALRLASAEPSLFAHLKHPAPHALVKSGAWTSGDGLTWQREAGGPSDLAPPDVVIIDGTSQGAWEAIETPSTEKPQALLASSALASVHEQILASGWTASAIPDSSERLWRRYSNGV